LHLCNEAEAKQAQLMNARVTLPLVCLLSGLTACTVAPGPNGAAEAVGTAREDGLSANGLSANGLSANGLSANGLSANGLSANGLTSITGLQATLDGNPDAQLFLSYVISCALPSDQTVVVPSADGTTSYTFSGGLGVAPAWGSDAGSCDTTCQQWVSACVISRVNYLGVHVPLSIRGDNPGLAEVGTEATDYPDREATYFGNVFTAPQQLYACRTVGDDQTLIGRPCGDGADVSTCIIDVLGDCGTVCSETFADGSYGACATTADGTFVPAATVYRLPQ
jgi:GLTT repeat (6 copies)